MACKKVTLIHDWTVTPGKKSIRLADWLLQAVELFIASHWLIETAGNRNVMKIVQ